MGGGLLSTDMLKLLAAVADNGGSIDLDYDWDAEDSISATIDEAVRLGLLRGTSGTWASMESYELTNKGRRSLGLPETGLFAFLRAMFER